MRRIAGIILLIAGLAVGVFLLAAGRLASAPNVTSTTVSSTMPAGSGVSYSMTVTATRVDVHWPAVLGVSAMIVAGILLAAWPSRRRLPPDLPRRS